MSREADEVRLSPQVAVITARPIIGKSLMVLFDNGEIIASIFESIECFVKDGRAAAWTCVILDCGEIPFEPDLNEILPKVPRQAPLILLTEAGGFSSGFRHLMGAVFDIFGVPFSPPALLKSVYEAASFAAAAAVAGGGVGAVRAAAEGLTERERQVLGHLIRGQSAKLIGKELGISPRTVEAHRTRIMAKLSARNLADLVRIAVQATGEPFRRAPDVPL